MEMLFSQEDIAAIEKDVVENFETYWDVRVGTGDATERTIMTISKEKDLVFVTGNKDTGWEHLRDRHAPYSFKNYWIPTSKGRLKLQDPSKFHPAMMPILDYVKIADAIFTEENRNSEKNKQPDLFDVYIGSYTFRQERVSYRLVLYKGSKVVHTLFPETSNYKDGNATKFAKGPVRISFAIPPGYNDLRVPYLNAKDVPAYSILVRKFLGEMIERVMIVVHDGAGEDREYFVFGERKMEGPEQFDHKDMEMFQYGNLEDLEKFIKEIDQKGRIVSTKAVKVLRSDLEAANQPPEVEVDFELDGVKGHAKVRERYADGYIYYDVSNVRFDGGVQLDAAYDQPFSIMPRVVMNEEDTSWVKEGSEEGSALVTAIGMGILGQWGPPGGVLELTRE